MFWSFPTNNKKGIQLYYVFKMGWVAQSALGVLS